jgi:integrase
MILTLVGSLLLCHVGILAIRRKIHGHYYCSNWYDYFVGVWAMTTFNDMVSDYYSSYEYNDLRDETKADYKYLIGQVLDTKVEGRIFRSLDVKQLTTKMCKLAYNTWCDRGIHFANKTMAIARVVYNHGLRMEMVNNNPFNAVRRRKPKSRTTLWDKEHIVQLLDTAYSDFNTRNLGLIAQMAYEWCQRVGDMRLLKWSSIDFEHRRVHILQSKRRAEVYLPISDDLMDMLEQQHEDFGFQEYVAPRPYPIQGKYEPYTIYKMSKHGRTLIRSAGLPDTLRLSDLRRTGTTEMVQAGVGIGQIMSVTGHANPQSVKPYIKNTFDAANYALTKRTAHGKSTLDAAKDGDTYNV